MRGIFFYTAVIGCASGVFLRSFFVWGWAEVLFLLVVASGLGLVAWIQGHTRTSVTVLVALFLSMGALGVARYHSADTRVSPLHDQVGVVGAYTGVVAREPEARALTQHLYVRDDRTGALFLVLADRYLDVSYGDRVTVEGTLALPEAFSTDTGRMFDYPGYLKARGVREIIEWGEVTVIDRGQGNPMLRGLFVMKEQFMTALESSIPEPAVGLGEGLLLGVKRALGEELEDIFRTVGIIHIVVLSGYNIMIVADFVMRILGYAFYPRTRLVLGIGTIVLFALMVGLSATVVRASLMAVLVLIARALGRPYAALRALSFAGVVMIMVNPYLIAFDPGFQLSFLATMGLVLLAPSIEKRLTLVPTLGGLRGYLGTTIATQLSVLPVLLFSMGTFSLVSILANVLVLPMVPIAMLFTLIAGVAGSVFLPLGIGVGVSAYGVLMYIIQVAYALAAIPHALMTVPVFPWWGVVLMYVPLGLLTYVLVTRDRVFESEGSSAGLVSTVNSTEQNTTKENAYADWTIMTWDEYREELRKRPGPGASTLPFR